MKCECKYYLMNKEGIRVCSVCGEPAHPVIEDKMTKKAPLYVSDRDKAKPKTITRPPIRIIP